MYRRPFEQYEDGRDVTSDDLSIVEVTSDIYIFREITSPQRKNMSDTKLPSIQDLNTTQDGSFLKAVNILFETAPPLSKALLAARPFKSYDELIDRSDKMIEKLSPDEKLEVNHLKKYKEL